MNTHTLAGFVGVATVTTVAVAAVDYTGIAVLIGAITVAGTGIVTSVLTVLTFMRQGEAAKLARETHDLVNGIAKESKANAKKADFAEGKEAGIEKERADPKVSAPPPT